MSYLELTDDDIRSADAEIQAPQAKLGVLVFCIYTLADFELGTAVVGNGVMGSSMTSLLKSVLIIVFYCFAAILPASGIYSIISLFISGLLLNVFRPIMRENASAIPYNGGNYSYLVNFTTKGIAIVAATITSLDAVTTVSSLPGHI